MTSSPFLLHATIRHHLENSSSDPAILAKLLNGFYVDDLITAASDEAEAYLLDLANSLCIHLTLRYHFDFAILIIRNIEPRVQMFMYVE